MIRRITLLAVLLSSISGAAFSMINQQVKCIGFDSDKRIEIESLLEQDGRTVNLVWATGKVQSPRNYESGLINMFPGDLNKFSYGASELNVSLVSSLNPARIEFRYNFKTQKGEGKVVVPTYRFDFEISGSASLSCNLIQTDVEKKFPHPPMPSGIYNYLLPSDMPQSIALHVEETQITFQVVGSSNKVVLTSEDGLTWNSSDVKCPVSLQSTTAMGRTWDSFYLSELTSCEYAKNLGFSLAGPYRLAQ